MLELLEAHPRGALGWDISSKLKAQREVEDMLKRDVDSDWLEHEVEDAVQDVLAAWDDEDEDW